MCVSVNSKRNGNTRVHAGEISASRCCIHKRSWTRYRVLEQSWEAEDRTSTESSFDFALALREKYLDDYVGSQQHG